MSAGSSNKVLLVGGALAATLLAAGLLSPGTGSGGAPVAAGIRGRVLGLIREWIPSETGDGRFEKLLGAPTGPGRWKYYETGFGSSCAVVAASLLALAKCNQDLINMAPEDGGGGATPGQAMTKIIEGAKGAGAWRGGPSLAGIQPGDLYVLATPPKGTDAHIGFFLARDGDVMTTADAGQKDADGEQAARIVKRTIRGGAMSGPNGLAPFRPIQGYVDLEAACRKAVA